MCLFLMILACSLFPLSNTEIYTILIAAIHVRATLDIRQLDRRIEGWMDVFYDKVMANAALDRIINKAYSD